MVGLDAARFPGVGSQDPILLDGKRAALTGSDLPTSADRLDERRFRMAALLARLRGSVTLSYAAWEPLEGRTLTPSPLLLQLYRRVAERPTAGFEDLDRFLGDPLSRIPRGDARLDTEDVWLSALRSDGRRLDGEAVVRAAFGGLAAGLYARAARAGDRAGPHHGVVCPRPVLDLRSDYRNVLSSRRLEALGTCPLRYFYRYVLGIAPADDHAGKQAAKRLCDRFNELVQDGSTAERVLDQWWAHRYPTAMRFAKGAADGLLAHRRAAGRLDFQDLLDLAARLLRTSPAARAELGRRWRRLLVDEFQDTDPLQAEVLFLLASDGADGGDWTHAVPRAGALFVVGDPKQSIYRFRRADIALYTRVRERFASFGRVLTLTSNFRSGAPIARLVNDRFAPPDGFPAEGNERQAGFAALVPQPREQPTREGVFQYAVPIEGRVRNEVIAAWESDAVAEWVASRIASGERSPGDFLILTRKKEPLSLLARALEGRGLAVQVSGAGVWVEDEVAELTLLLRALTDPSDSALIVAVLIGLFFGLDHEQLLAHREAGRSFDLRWALHGPAGPDHPVEAALARLRGWWELARKEPADVAVGRIAEDLGLLPHAAAGELGSIRAGALGFVLDAVRSSGLEGDTSLTGALEALAAALSEEEAEAPLEPGRREVVRLMNLHKAKGLEASVVVLAAPYGTWQHRVKRHVERTPDGRARGWLVVEQEEGWDTRTLARPARWSEKAEREARFLEAEELRLLYVAATRAGEELVIARPGNPKAVGKSPWGEFDAWLASPAHAEALRLAPVPAPPRERLDLGPEEIATRVAVVDAARAACARPGTGFTTVTAEAKEASSVGAEEDDESLPPLRPTSSGPGGYEWGSVVHAVLEAAASGATQDRLRALARSLLLELDRPSRAGEPTELDALMATVDGVRNSALWRRAGHASHRLAEIPFTLELEPDTYLEGVIDLAFREPDGWVVVDYKTDRGSDPEFAARRLGYREQLRRYGEAWSRLTGEPVKERVILWTRTGREEEVT